jgi:hypothetical protein
MKSFYLEYINVCMYKLLLGVNAMFDNIRNLSLKDLFQKLHDEITDFIENAERIIEINESIKIDNIRQIRDHITERLNKNEDIEENKLILKILDVFITDKSFIRIMRKDADDWLEFLDALEGNLKKVGKDFTEKDKMELNNVIGIIDNAKKIIRR